MKSAPNRLINLVSKGLALPILGAALIFQGCETDIDVNAPYEDNTIVYGLLSPVRNFVDLNTKHAIKINKAFLGEGNALDYAQVRDSLEYSDLTGVVEELTIRNSDTSVARTFPIYAETVENKEEGIFFGPEQTIYFFDAELNEERLYRLRANVQGGENSKQVTAVTTIVYPFSFTGRTNAQQALLNFATETAFTSSIEFEWQAARNAKRHELFMEWTYTNFYEDGSGERITLVWEMGTVTATNDDGSEEMVVAVGGEEFFQFIAARVPAFGETTSEAGSPLIQRLADSDCFLIAEAGGTELSTYIDVNEPSTSLIQERPEYTNVKGGIGIFSSRTRTTILKDIGQPTLEELVTGNLGGYTNEQGFSK